MDLQEGGAPSGSDNAQRQKRSRVLLSCAPCRHSKLKCDRGQPCSQCLKKDRLDLCTYAPKPEKRRPAKGVAARLRRLEGMVREMMDGEGNVDHLATQLQNELPEGLGARRDPDSTLPTAVDGNLVAGQHTTTYVGATHCMAMLEDIEDLKEYFDDPDEEEDADSPAQLQDDSEEWLILASGAPMDRQELLRWLPEKSIMDRLIMRYFTSMSPSQHIVHQPTFTKAYARFFEDQDAASYHWLALLFMVLALGVHFNRFQNLHEIDKESFLSLEDRIKHYRACAGWALVRSRFSRPTFRTLPAFLLYVESHFLLNRSAQMSCYLLSGVFMRLMLKMGLHRDPSKLTNISPFEGEMRRRIWNMGIQLETIASFHVGLPSMIPGIESDVKIPHNLHDEDLEEDCKELPPERPYTDWTVMSYPIQKTRLIKAFDKIGRQAHALQTPRYAEVLQLDDNLNKMWKSLPSHMVVRPLEECVGDSPNILMQRFGLASLYNKARCVLHRRFLAEAVPKREHDFSRQQALDGALALLGYQHAISEACKPGHMLGQNGWFISSLIVHDYLLAAMVVYLVIQNEHYAAEDSEHAWQAPDGVSPSKEELKFMLRRSYNIWSGVAEDLPELRKTADTLVVMLVRLGEPVDGPTTSAWKARLAKGGEVGTGPGTGSSYGPRTEHSGSEAPAASSSWGFDSTSSAMDAGPTPFMVAQAIDGAPLDFPAMDLNGGPGDMMSMEPAWMADINGMDWRYLDVSLAHSQTAGLNAEPGAAATWMERLPMNGGGDFDTMPMDGALWGQHNGHGNMGNGGMNGI